MNAAPIWAAPSRPALRETLAHCAGVGLQKFFCSRRALGQIEGINRPGKPLLLRGSLQTVGPARLVGFLAPIWGDPCPPSPRCRLCFSLSCFPRRFVLFRRCVLFGPLPAVGTRLRGQNEPIFQGSFCRFPVREVSGIGLQPCPPSGAAQPPPAGTESTPFGVCASSVCTYIALHIERLTGLYAPRRFTASARPHLPFYAR